MVVAESESRRRHRMPWTKWSLLNLNPNETKRLLPNPNLEEGIGCLGLNDRCRI